MENIEDLKVQQGVEEKRDYGLLKEAVLALVGVVVVLVIVIFLLNYFNILSLSKIFPQSSSSSISYPPKGKVNTPNPSVSQEPVAIGPTPKLVSCPVSVDLCSSVIVLEKNLSEGGKKYGGLGWMVPKSTAVQAIFEGTYKEEAIFGVKVPVRRAILETTDRSYTVEFIYVAGGELSEVEQRAFRAGINVKRGDVLFFVQEGSLAEVGLDKVNLQMNIIDKNKGGASVELKAEDLERLLLM